MAKNNAVVGVYNTHTEAETAVKELQHSGFDMKKLSIKVRRGEQPPHQIQESLPLW